MLVKTMGLLLAIALVGCCCRKSDETKRHEAAEAKALAETKKVCGAKFGTNDWEESCRALVKKELANPSTAKFSALLDRTRGQNPADCKQFYSDIVTAKNGLGIEQTFRFSCGFDARKNDVLLIDMVQQ